MRNNMSGPLAVCLVLICIISCAKQGFPPGGPEDDVPPTLEQTIPEAGATGVSRHDPLVFMFSEQMDEQSVEENFFIVPIPAQWPVLSWRDRSRTLVVEFASDLASDATYVVSIGAKSSDRNRNALEESFMLTFSTGDVLESKRVTGRVLDEGFLGPNPESASQIDVIAYRAESGQIPDPRNDVPDYVTQTGVDGTYELIGLSRGSYHLYAIGDNDHDGFYTENYDRIGIESREISLAESDTVAFAPDLIVAMRRTDDIQLTSARAPDNRRVELFFDREVNPQNLKVEIPDLVILNIYRDDESPRKVTLMTSEQESGHRYEISRLEATDRDGNSVAPFDFIPFFDGTDEPDTTTLNVTKQVPALITRPDEPVELTFNRPLDLPDGLSGILSPDDRLSLGIEHSAPNKLLFTPVEEWQSGLEYRILLDPERLRGSAGNRLTEEGAQVTISVALSDTLSAISGTLADEQGSGPYRILIRQPDSTAVHTVELDMPGSWSSGPLIPGSYVLYAHRDNNADDIVDLGWLDPFRQSEQITAYADTVVLEARWPKEDCDIIFE